MSINDIPRQLQLARQFMAAHKLYLEPGNRNSPVALDNLLTLWHALAAAWPGVNVARAEAVIKAFDDMEQAGVSLQPVPAEALRYPAGREEARIRLMEGTREQLGRPATGTFRLTQFSFEQTGVKPEAYCSWVMRNLPVHCRNFANTCMFEVTALHQGCNLASAVGTLHVCSDYVRTVEGVRS